MTILWLLEEKPVYSVRQNVGWWCSLLRILADCLSGSPSGAEGVLGVPIFAVNVSSSPLSLTVGGHGCLVPTHLGQFYLPGGETFPSCCDFPSSFLGSNVCACADTPALLLQVNVCSLYPFLPFYFQPV